MPHRDSPFVVDLRHQLGVGLRNAFLEGGHPLRLLRYVDVRPFDGETLERAADQVAPGEPGGGIAARPARAYA